MHPTTGHSDHPWQRAVTSTFAEAIGGESRVNPVLPRTGGPAGNALLTAWTGLALLMLSLAELLTLFDVRGLISWHVALGALLVPPALMKTTSTGWRIVRFYTGSRPYVAAGPPPLLLRLLGPLVIFSTLGLLGTGVLLILLGEDRARRTSVSMLGFRADWLTAHQAFFAAWCVAAGLHLLGRIVPTLRSTVLPRSDAEARLVPGRWTRVLWFAAMIASAGALAVVLVHADGSWASFHRFGPGDD